MVWLQSPPWARWAAALLIAAASIWLEVRPETTVLHPFAVEDIDAGSVIDESNTETRSVPIGTFEPIEMGLSAVEPISLGDPILATDVGDGQTVVPRGWWVVEMELPGGANRGDASRLVLLDDGRVIEGVVVTEASDDPLGTGLGMIAVEPEAAAGVARAAAEGRVAVMVAPP
jgi:hypothetical protein